MTRAKLARGRAPADWTKPEEQSAKRRGRQGKTVPKRSSFWVPSLCPSAGVRRRRCGRAVRDREPARAHDAPDPNHSPASRQRPSSARACLRHQPRHSARWRAILERLRAEAAEAAGRSEGRERRGCSTRIAGIEERLGDEPAAARDYLAAFNSDGSFREPIEGLLRLLERRRSLGNLGKLVDALERGAEAPDEHVRAKTLRAYFLEDVGGDAEAAKKAALEASEVEGAAPAEAAMVWLTLELIAARVGDTDTRLQALSKRPDLARDPTWRALLRIDAAKLQGAAGDFDAALETLRQARAEGAGATFPATVAAERLARRRGDASGPVEAEKRSRAYAEALEAQGALIEEALASPARGDALGVPRWTRSPVTMVDAWLRGAEAQSLSGDDAAAAALSIARATLWRASKGAKERRSRRTLRSAPRSSTRVFGWQSGRATRRWRPRWQRNGSRASKKTRERRTLVSPPHSPCASPSMPRAKGTSLARSLRSRPPPKKTPCASLRVRCSSTSWPTTSRRHFAAQLEALAEHLPTDDGRSQALLLAAWVWGARANDARGARLALGQASVAGAPDETTSRIARTLASIAGDVTWYEEATKRLLAGAPRDDDPAGSSERAMLWLELASSRFARGALDEARTALKELGATSQGAWLGRALEAFLPNPRRSADDA